MSTKSFLVVIETQRVKGYVFASPILRETRGASLLLDRLNRIETGALLRGTPGVEEIYLGGGSGRVLFDSESKAEGFAKQVRTLYGEKTHNARISVEVVPRGGQESFPAWMARGVRESQHNKLARREAVPLLAGRWIRPCSSCGKEPAEGEPLTDIQGTHHLCRACGFKRQAVKSFYRETKRNWDLRIPLPHVDILKRTHPHFILTTLAEAVHERFGPRALPLLPQDFHQIAERSSPRNYIGFIYADGNRMGETIKEMGKKFSEDAEAKQAYRAFSHIVDQATREAAVQAVLEHVGTTERRTPRGELAHFIPAEFVLAGGDDLVLIVPADTALSVAARFITLFQQQTKKLQQAWERQGRLSQSFAPGGLTTSAGVVLAHASYPASQLMDMAGELMKLAKRKAVDLADDPNERAEGTLDFMVLHTPGSEGVKHRRRTEYESDTTPSGYKIKRTERPYTARQLVTLLKRIRTLKSSAVPRSQLKALYPLLFQGGVRAQFDAQHIKARLKTTGALTTGPLQELLRELPLFPFRQQDASHTWTTPLSELIEIYDFVPPEPTSPVSEGTHA